jgi:AcrR family transcriptional regulator
MATAETDGRLRRSEATRSALVAAARKLFTERGYAGVSTAEIVEAAGVTRNALYYHFPTKESLFRAVYEEVESGIARRNIPAALEEPDLRRQLQTGCALFLDACLDPTVAQISVREAPAVLGFPQMREIDNENYLGVLTDALRDGIEDGELLPLSPQTLAAMLIGALDEAALLIASAPRPRRAREEAGEVVAAIIDGLFAESRVLEAGR